VRTFCAHLQEIVPKTVVPDLGLNPIRTTVVSEGTFKRYMEARVREGAELANLRPKHLEPVQLALISN
jgi:hypothetical protein